MVRYYHQLAYGKNLMIYHNVIWFSMVNHVSPFFNLSIFSNSARFYLHFDSNKLKFCPFIYTLVCVNKIHVYYVSYYYTYITILCSISKCKVYNKIYSEDSSEDFSEDSSEDSSTILEDNFEKQWIEFGKILNSLCSSDAIYHR